jgi:5-methyltetrahydrofolate--homocysteine methyltransferase
MGTSLPGRESHRRDFGGPQYEGCNEYLVVTRPDVIERVHRGFLDAGADIIETDTVRLDAGRPCGVRACRPSA